ncbi:MAG: TonB family protein [Nitrospiraceae bacterium]|nr:TonB family protein [Nitrospiraceae bacterium]
MEPPKPRSVRPVQDLLSAPITTTPTPDARKPDSEDAPPVPKEVVKQETVKEPEPVREAVTEPVAPRETYSVPELSHTQASAQAHEEPPAVAGPPPVATETAHSSSRTAPAVNMAKPSEMPPAAANPPATSTDPEPSMQVAKAAPQPLSRAPEAKADHRWVGESLWRRVAELKRYPSTARLNGLEGRVVLKAIIRADGHLAEVSVVKSSGHAVLDAAAMEAVKLACPLHMKHSIGPPQIVVSLPIVYSLAN